jgi:hypothetical protein
VPFEREETKVGTRVASPASGRGNSELSEPETWFLKPGGA